MSAAIATEETLVIETPERAMKITNGRVWVTYTSPSPGGSGVVVINPRTNRADAPIPFSRLGTSMVAAAEAAVGLAIIIAVFRARATLAVDRIDLMKL